MEDGAVGREVVQCLLCHDAPCSKACPHNLDPAKVLRSLRFSNVKGAIKNVTSACHNCPAPCEKSCVLNGEVSIKEVLENCYEKREKLETDYKKADIRSDICGIEIENPFLLSSSVVSSSYDMCKRAFEAGWAGVAFKTICMMDIHEASPRFSAVKGFDGSFTAFKNIEQLSDHSVVENVEIFQKLKAEFPNKFLLVSIMGRDEEEWAFLAKVSESAGADALELNFSCPNMTEDGTGSDVGQIPELVEKYTRAVTSVVKIPVIAKLTPNVMTMSPAAEAAKRGGAKGLAAINTIKSIADLNFIDNVGENSKNRKVAVGGLSGQAVKPIALRFIAELAQNKNLQGMHLSAMGGIYDYKDALAFLSLGARSIQITTAVMEYGYRIIDDLVEGLQYFVAASGHKSLKELLGANLDNVVDVEEIERDVVVYPKFLRDKCVHCGRCYLSCRDGGHQAISFDKNRMPILDPKKCVGCHLCVLVCPNKAIVSSEIKVKKKTE